MATWDHIRFRDYVLTAAANVRLTSTADIAREADLKPGMLSKWFSGQEQPSISSLRRLAPAIRSPLAHLVVLAGRADPEDLDISDEPIASPVLLDPLARELDYLLSDRSPLDARQRDTIRGLVEAVLAQHRRSTSRRRGA